MIEFSVSGASRLCALNVGIEIVGIMVTFVVFVFLTNKCCGHIFHLSSSVFCTAFVLGQES